MDALMALVLAAGIGMQERQQSATERYRGARVRDVRFALEGAELPEAARDLIDVESGELYRPQSVRRSIQQLFALGVFSDIKVEAERVPGEKGEVDVLFRLFPRLEVRGVELTGLEGSSAALKGLEPRLIEESRVRVGDPLNVDELSAAAERIRDVLHEEGYLWATVEPEASFQSPTAVVVFHVDPRRRAEVGSIQISGAAPHIEAHIRREIGLKGGSVYSRAELDERVAKISSSWHSRGYYGAELNVEAVAVDGSEAERVDLHLSANLGPRVHVEVEGDFSEKTIRKLVPLFGETLLTEDLVEESRANLEQNLRERGYRDAVVRVARETVAEGRHLFLRFEVDAGRRFETMAIEVEGLRSVPESDVRSLLATRTRRRFRSAPFQESVWKQDLEVVRSYLRRQGFHAAVVSGRESTSARAAEELTLVASIEEGPRALVASLGIEGASQLDSASVLKASGLAPGAPFDPAGVREARDRILTHYQNRGFRQVSVQFRTTLDDAGTSASVEFDIDEGVMSRVDRVILSGLEATKESSVRRLVTVQSGMPLSQIDILETRQKLVASGLFRSVQIEILPADPFTHRSDVLISVVEGPRTTFAYGFGFEERQLLRAEVEVTRRNLFGLNRTVSVFTRASFRGGRFITTYRQPDSILRNLPLFVSVYAEEEARTSFDYNRVGVGLQISKRLNEEQNLFFRYRFDRTKVFRLAEGVDIEDIDRRFRNVRIGALSVASLTDRRDDPLNPRTGQFRILDLEWSSELLGTEAPYLKGLARQFYYFPLPRNMVAALGLRLGLAQPRADAVVPIAERFFAGGATTLRGFALDQASPKQLVEPKDEDGNPIMIDGEPLVVEGQPIGGNVLSLVNLELRFPILGNLRGVVFSDNGAVYRRIETVQLSRFRYNVGFGVRYETPLGPLRVDYGLKLNRRTRYSIDCPDVTVPCTESLGRFHVSLGHAF